MYAVCWGWGSVDGVGFVWVRVAVFGVVVVVLKCLSLMYCAVTGEVDIVMRRLWMRRAYVYVMKNLGWDDGVGD